MTRNRLLVLLVALACLAGTGVATVDTLTRDKHRPVTILASWTGGEERAFTALLDRSGIPYDYQGTTSVRQVLSAEVQSGTPPDIAVLPGPGELAGYVDDGVLKPLDGDVFTKAETDSYGPPWTPRIPDHPGSGRLPAQRTYWVPVKADLKSLFWHVERDQGAGGPYCLGMGAGATSGWPGTDWVEDIVLQQSGAGAYERWARGKLSWQAGEIRNAWVTWGKLISPTTGRKGGVGKSLKDDYTVAGKGLFAKAGDASRCEAEHQGSFIRGFYGTGWKRASITPSAEVLGTGSGKDQPWEVSADLAAMFHDTPEARGVMRYLASAGTQRRWAGQPPQHRPPGFSANRHMKVVTDTDPVSREIARRLRTAATLCFDASDTMPPSMRDAFYRAVLAFLAAPDRLDELLQQLEQVRRSVNEPWLPPGSVCG